MRLPTGRLAIVLLALAIGVALTVSPATAATYDSSEPSAAALLQQAEALASPTPTSPFARVAAATDPRDGTAVMVALAQALPRLSGSDRARAQALLRTSPRISQAAAASTGVPVPVTGEGCDGDSGTQYYVDNTTDGHFAIYFALTGTNAVESSYPTEVESVLATVYDHEINQMGFQAPLTPDGGPRTPIFLCNIASNLYGFCAPTVDPNTTVSVPAACTLRNNYDAFQNPALDGPDPNAPLMVTAAHEFFHAVQFRQDVNEPLWLMEGTAVWMENEVYPAIHDYLQYLPFTGIRQPLTPFNATTAFTPYADFAFFKAITGILGDKGVVKQIWSYLGQNPAISAMNTLKHVIAAHNRTLASVMLSYSIWNTLAPHTYPSGNLYRPPTWWLHRTMGRANRLLPSTGVRIRRLAAAPIGITRGPRVVSTTKLQIGITGPSGAVGGWFTVRRQLTNGTSLVSRYRIGAHGSVVTIPFNASVRYVAITLNNEATAGGARYFSVRAKVL